MPTCEEPMSAHFFDQPILNSPYQYPARHWELDVDGQPTNRILEQRRAADFVSPVPKPKKQKGKLGQQLGLVIDHGFLDLTAGMPTLYNPTAFINTVRREVDVWRALPPAQWRVTPETARLLQHWRHHQFTGVRPFFCQLEAVETAIWLTEVAPQLGKVGKEVLDHLTRVNEQANPELLRVALKLATGAGKTTVMAMLIAWQTINAVRHPQIQRFTRAFVIIAPGLTIRDRLRVLQPNDPDSYYTSRQLVPSDLLADVNRAKIVITNYHAFKRRELLNLASGTRSLLQGSGAPLDTLESEGQMLQRVMAGLTNFKHVLVINDEAHHCYRERPDSESLADLKGDEKEAAQRNNAAARVWISGIEAIKRTLGVRMVYDLSATPFFLGGSGYIEGTLFPWTVSDFSLLDAIEAGIVKLPRVPVADNVPGGDMPKFRVLWEHIGSKMPKKGKANATNLDPLSLPAELQTALQALYGHYDATFTTWQDAGVTVPPVFIVVCNNTATSKLVYDYISGFHRQHADGDHADQPAPPAPPSMASPARAAAPQPQLLPTVPLGRSQVTSAEPTPQQKLHALSDCGQMSSGERSDRAGGLVGGRVLSVAERAAYDARLADAARWELLGEHVQAERARRQVPFWYLSAVAASSKNA